MKLRNRIKSIWRLIAVWDGNDTTRPMPNFDGSDDRYLIDFREDRFAVPVDPAQQTIKVTVTPKDVICELGRKPTLWSLDGLDEKIKMLEEKRKLISQKYAAEEVDGLVLCLKNRKKYDHRTRQGLTFRELFSRFDATDQSHIDALCKKHSLVFKPADIFIPEFPDEATKVMADVTEATKQLCGKSPRLFVIATEDQFRDVNNKRDPILLAQSPFGFYYYILGAWDKEMLYLPEL